MFTLYKKELSYYLNNAVGYIVVILFAVFVNFLYIKDIFIVGSASMRPFFSIMPWLLMIFIPALTMRTLSEEKRVNTIELLQTLPISEAEIILSKFFALLTLVFVGLFLTLGLPISLSFLTKLYLPEILIGYAGILLLSSSFVALSMFFSSQTKNQVIAFLSSIIALFLFLVLSSDFLATLLPKAVQDFASYFSPMYHLQNFTKGLVDIRSLGYFLSMTILFLFLSVIDLEKRG